MASLPCADINSNIIFCKSRAISLMGMSAFPLQQEPRARTFQFCMKGRVGLLTKGSSPYPRKGCYDMLSKKVTLTIPRCSNSSEPSASKDESSNEKKAEFGYSRKDVLLIGVGVTLAGYGLKSGLEYFGVDPLQAGNVVQLVLVLGLTVAWISTYIFRVSNKEMTYAQQLRDYENKVMQKRLEGLTEAELEALLEQVEEEKRRLAKGEKVN